MAFEDGSWGAVEVPQTDGAIAAGGGELGPVGGEHHLSHPIGVAFEFSHHGRRQYLVDTVHVAQRKLDFS